MSKASKSKHLYEYFVSYMGNHTSDNSTRLSNCRLLRKNPINSWEDIQDIQKDIDKSTVFKNVTIINYQLLHEGLYSKEDLSNPALIGRLE